METFLVSLVAASIGALLTTRVQRFHATWLKRRDIAAEAYAAAVAVHSATQSAVSFVRHVDAEGNRTRLWRDVAESADWNLVSMLDASMSRLNKLREARLNVRSIWGDQIAGLFDDYFDLASAWHNAFGAYRHEMMGISPPDDDRWNADAASYNWERVVGAVLPDAEDFDRELQDLMEMIRKFARSAGVVTTDLLGLPWGAQEVVAELGDHRQRRALAAARRSRALAPPR